MNLNTVRIICFLCFFTLFSLANSSCETKPVKIISPLNGSSSQGGEQVVFEAEIHLDAPDAPGYNYAWEFGDGAFGNVQKTVYAYDRKGDYTVTLTVTDNYSRPVGSDTIRVSVLSSRFVKLDTNGGKLDDHAENWTMVYDTDTGLVWEVKQNRDLIMDYANPHDADNIYSWYDSNPGTNGGDPGHWGDGHNTEVFISTLNDRAFGGWTDWRLPTCDELRTIQNMNRFNPAANTDYFPNTRSWFYWTSTTYDEIKWPGQACHLYFMGFPRRPVFTVRNHYGCKSYSFLVRAVRDYK